MNLCEIIAIKSGKSFRWKWRALGTEGGVKQSERTYELYYECVSAARQKGYQPNTKCL